jgi:hypothetical protein
MTTKGPKITPAELLKNVERITGIAQNIINPRLHAFQKLLKDYKIDLDVMLIQGESNVDAVLKKVKKANINLSMTETFFIDTIRFISQQLNKVDTKKLSEDEQQILQAYKGGEYSVDSPSKLLGLALDLKKFELALNSKLEEISQLDVNALREDLKALDPDELSEQINESKQAFLDENDFGDGFGLDDYEDLNMSASRLAMQERGNGRLRSSGTFSAHRSASFDLSGFSADEGSDLEFPEEDFPEVDFPDDEPSSPRIK